MKKAIFLIVLFFQAFGSEIDLRIHDQGLYSQNGEDGVISRILQLLGPVPHFCVDFGAYDGMTGSNTYLLRLQGWDSLLMDRLYEVPEKKIHKEFITAENINQLFRKYNVPDEFGVLSIDVDYNDFYIWRAIHENYRPAIVVIEYNGMHLPDQDKVVKYRPFFCGGGDNYFGASILALYNLGRSKGYSLVYAEQSGTNLFFVKDEIIAAKNLHFKNMNDVEKLYVSPKYGNGPNGGHKQDPRSQEYLRSTELLP
jgi:hypothetical protein